MMMLFPKDSQFYAIVKVQSRSYRGYLCYAEYEKEQVSNMRAFWFSTVRNFYLGQMVVSLALGIFFLLHP